MMPEPRVLWRAPIDPDRLDESLRNAARVHRAVTRRLDTDQARKAFTGVTITADTLLWCLDGYHGTPRSQLGAAALLACHGGRYADPDVADLFDGWQRTHHQTTPLPAPLRLAAKIEPAFRGTVGELTALVTAVLAEQQH